MKISNTNKYGEQALLKYAPTVLLILGLTGSISGAGLPWAKYTTPGLGLILLLLPFTGRPGK